MYKTKDDGNKTQRNKIHQEELQEQTNAGFNTDKQQRGALTFF